MSGTGEVRPDWGEMVGRSTAMREVYETSTAVARYDTSVLIEGETGCGKEVLARSIHRLSARRERRFVPLNVANLPESLLESELFGHVRGAFSGAERPNEGLAAAAAGGTLFVDEVGELSPAAQVKLLRFLDTREIRAVGSSRIRRVDVRVISATNRDLRAMMRDGSLRQDFYYRLSVLRLRLPALRERPDDIERLAEHFVALFNGRHSKRVPGLHSDAVSLLQRHSWRGNVRELKNEIERAVVLTPDGEKIRASVLSFDPSPGPRVVRHGLRAVRRTAEREAMVRAVNDANWNVSAAARRLGMSREGLTRKLRRFEIRRPVATV